MLEVLVEFPETHPGLKLGFIGNRLPDDATQFDAINAFHWWANAGWAGVENRTLVAGTSPVTLHIVER